MKIQKSFYVLFLSIVTSLLLAGLMTGCGGGGEDDGGGGTADTTPPTVLSVQPASGAAGVSINTVVTVTFSEDMNDATITADTVTLTAETAGASALAATVITGTVTYADRVATFTPAEDIPWASTFTGRVTTGAQDLAGNGLTQDYTWSFTSGEEPDTVGPTVLVTSPSSGATGLEPYTSVSVQFTEPVNPSTVTVDNFFLTRTGSGYPEPGEVELNSAGTIATFTPDYGLPLGTECRAEVTTGIQDLAGNPLSSGVMWSFTAREGSWGSAPVTLQEESGTGEILNTSIAFYEPGRAHAVWHHYAGNDPSHMVYISSSSYNGALSDPWSSPQNINESHYEFDGSSYSVYPHIASNRAGTGFAVWRNDPNLGRIYSARVTSNGWGSIKDVFGSDINTWNAEPRVGVDTEENGLAVCTEANDDYLRASWFDADSGSWTPFMETISGMYAYQPRIAFHRPGKANVVWMNYLSGRYVPYYNLLENGEWEGHTGIVTDFTKGTVSVEPPALDTNMDGVSFAAWTGQIESSGYYIYAARFRYGNWGNAQVISDTYSQCYDPDVAVDRAGNAIVVWAWMEDSGIQANRYDADAGEWEGVIQLSDSHDDQYPEVAFDLNGNAVVVWHNNGNPDFIYTRRIEAGSDWSAESFTEKLDISGEGDFQYDLHRLDADPNGRFITVWVDYDKKKIHANMYD